MATNDEGVDARESEDEPPGNTETDFAELTCAMNASYEAMQLKIRCVEAND